MIRIQFLNNKRRQSCRARCPIHQLASVKWPAHRIFLHLLVVLLFFKAPQELISSINFKKSRSKPKTECYRQDQINKWLSITQPESWTGRGKPLACPKKIPRAKRWKPRPSKNTSLRPSQLLQALAEEEVLSFQESTRTRRLGPKETASSQQGQEVLVKSSHSYATSI